MEHLLPKGLLRLLVFDGETKGPVLLRRLSRFWLELNGKVVRLSLKIRTWLGMLGVQWLL